MEKNRKVLTGTVVSDKMNKTIVVLVETKSKHKLYDKLVITHKKYHAHDEKEECKIGDYVRIVETRPISKTKCWKLDEIIEKSK